MIPKPLPFLRFGLANLPVMLSIDLLPFPYFCLLILIKIMGQGLIGGTLFSYIFLFSAAGTATSAFLMLLLRKALPKSLSYVGISVAGAFASNAAQLLMARFYIFGESAWYIAPPFLAVGALSGALLGFFANQFACKSAWYAGIRAGTVTLQSVNAAPELSIQRNGKARYASGGILLLLLLFSNNLWVMTSVLVLTLFLLITGHERIRVIPIVTMSVSILLFNILVPFGKILWSPFGLPITEGALLSGIKKALIIEGMIFISRWMLKGGFSLPGKTGHLISRSFDILAHLSENRKRFNPKKIVESIDSIMFGRG